MSFQIREATIDDIDALCSLTTELKGPFDFLYV